MSVTDNGGHTVILDHATLLVEVPVHAQEDEARIEERRNFEFDEPPCSLQGVEGSLNTEEVRINGMGKIFARMDFYVVYECCEKFMEVAEGKL